MIKNVIVTGGTGVTGNALVNYLLNRGISVTALVRPGSFRKKYLPISNSLLKVIDCGMDNYDKIDCMLEKGTYDAFFHLSWDGSTGKVKVGNRNNFKLQNMNVGYSLDAVELCNRIDCPVFIMTGSQAQYGRKNVPIREGMEKCPENGYGIAKNCAEEMTRLLCKSYGIHHIWAILFSVYGPNDATESLIDTTIRGLMEGKVIPYTKGEQQWDYLYSYDAAKALLLLAEHGIDGEVYHIAQGESAPLKDYISRIYRVMTQDDEPCFGEIEYSENTVMYLGADTSKLVETTGFFTEYTFEEGIKEIVETIQLEKGKA